MILGAVTSSHGGTSTDNVERSSAEVVFPLLLIFFTGKSHIPSQIQLEKKSFDIYTDV